MILSRCDNAGWFTIFPYLNKKNEKTYFSKYDEIIIDTSAEISFNLGILKTE